MTVEQTTSITADDLEHFTFACVNVECGAIITVPLKAEMEPVWACPVCRENWFREYKERVDAFKSLVKALIEFKRTDAPFSLRLQLKTPPASVSDTSKAS
jgi:hypothetical protein